mgnify:CR=1 FL=1
MTKIQLLATLLALFIFAMLGACNNEDYPVTGCFQGNTRPPHPYQYWDKKWLPAQKKRLFQRDIQLFSSQMR